MEQDAFDRLHLIHARLLYLIGEMHSAGRLSDQQKISLKCKLLPHRADSVFKDEGVIFDLYEDCKEDLAALKDRLEALSLDLLSAKDQ